MIGPERFDRHSFVALEGLSGVGKSTLARELADRLGALLVKTPMEPFLSARDQVDALAQPAARFHFYLAAVIDASARIERELYSRPVVCDRYIATTLCWHEVIGVPVPSGGGSLPIIEPDLTLLVTCGEPERNRRLKTRGMTRNDHEESRDSREAELLSAYRRFGLSEVDNSSTEIGQAVKAALEMLAEGAKPALETANQRT